VNKPDENEKNSSPDEEKSDGSSQFDGTLIQDEHQRDLTREMSIDQVQPPASVPGYRILSTLGEGAYGSVWLAQEINTGKQVAIKFYTHRGGLDWSLLKREVEKLAVLYTSRNIVRLLDVGWDSDPPYYIMEHLDNGSLNSFLSDGGIPTEEAVRITKSILQALVHAHGCGILHCDLKPANILLDSDFEPRICDFGQSRLSDEQDPALGTMFYMAPEQADLKAVPDAKWDVYALGSILYHMLTGKAPFRTEEADQQIKSEDSLEKKLKQYRQVLRNSPKPNLKKEIKGIDRPLADILERCLEMNPAKRFANAQAILTKLKERERQRSRRPIIAMGILGPTFLLLAMFPIGKNALETVVSNAQKFIMTRALESDELSARILARSLNIELLKKQAELVELAQSELLIKKAQEILQDPIDQNAPPPDFELVRRSAFEYLEIEKHGQDQSWFIQDSKGYMRWRNPYIPKTMNKLFNYRDYYHGHRVEYADPDAKPGSEKSNAEEKLPVPNDITPIQEPIISLPFISKSTGAYMVVINVPIKDNNGKVIGLLARSTHLKDLLQNFAQGIRENADVGRVVAIADCREWQILDHPWINKQKAQDINTDQIRFSDELINELKVLKKNVRSGKSSNNVLLDEHYIDPIATFEKEYEGEWLAAFALIGETGWAAIVQEKKQDALKPVEEMNKELLRYGLWSVLVTIILIVTLLYFVLNALQKSPIQTYFKSKSNNRSDSESFPQSYHS
jgi:eukaryotic-like serine/threonine-protein kinase